VDVRSRPDNILDHFHCLVDCPNNRDPTWSAEKILGSGHGRVLFEKYGILKSLEIEKVDKVTERIIHRREEEGDRTLRQDTWRRTETKERAEQQCRTTTASRLKLCFEAFLRTSDKIVRVAEPVFSEEITDLHTASTGELAVTMMSVCSDNVEGGALLMTYTGNSNNKVNYKSSGFYAEFIQYQDPNNFESKVVWKQRVKISESQLHSVGQHLGGLWLRVPPYGDQHIRSPVGCYLQIVKHKKNKENDVEAKSDHYWFNYIPSIQQKTIKRKADPPGEMMMKIRKAEQQMQLQQPPQQIPVQIPVTQILHPIKEEQFLPAELLTPSLPNIGIQQPPSSMGSQNISVIKDSRNNLNRYQDPNSVQSPRTPSTPMYSDSHSVLSPSSHFANLSVKSPNPTQNGEMENSRSSPYPQQHSPYSQQLSPDPHLLCPNPQPISTQPNNFHSQTLRPQDIFNSTSPNYNTVYNAPNIYQQTLPTENDFADVPEDILAAILPELDVIVADGEKKPSATEKKHSSSESSKKSKDKHKKSSKLDILKGMGKLSLEE